MKLKKCLVALCFVLLTFAITSCGTKKQNKDQGKTEAPPASESVVTKMSSQPAQLPVRYQSPSFVTSNDTTDNDLGEKDDFSQIKVGATIQSKGGPIPLMEVLKRLANLKNMNVSWASDVNLYTPVDVDITANDNFFEAIANLIRQADYFYEVDGKTIIIGNKKTKTFQIGVPAMAGGYNTTVGGNFLSTKKSQTGTEGIIKISSNENKFDIWDNVDKNLQVILGVVVSSAEYVSQEQAEEKTKQESRENSQTTSEKDKKYKDTTKEDKSKISGDSKTDKEKQEKYSAKLQKITRQTADDGSFFVIDKSVGLITVTAKPNVLKKVEDYLENLKKELYRQVIIEAKIIEVFLNDDSKIGLDWSAVLKNFTISGITSFGTAGFGTSATGTDGQVYPWIKANGDADSVTRFVSKVALTPVTFNVMLNALNEQGDTHVLANPKITVLNGQPALISVGKDIAYIKTVIKTVDTSANGSTTFTAETDNVVEGVALGVMASIISDKKAVLHLTPLTTNLVGGVVTYKTFGNEGLQVGLPEVRVRQMSTMVEVENGEMLVIGGLIDSTEEKTGKFAPLVGSIPIIRYLFGYEEKTLQKRELVILLTPKII